MGKPLTEVLILFIALFWQIYMIAKILDYLFEINVKRRQLLLYIMINVLAGMFSRLFLSPEHAFLNVLIANLANYLTLKFIFKLSYLKSLFGVVLIIAVSIPIELFGGVISTRIFGRPENLNNIIELVPSFLLMNVLFTLVAYLIYLFKNKYGNFSFKEVTSSSLFLTPLLTVCFILPNVIFYATNRYNYPLYLLVYNILASIGLVLIGIYDTHNTTQLQLRKRDLENAQLYNAHLHKLIDSIRVFKHDYTNVVQSIGGYVALKDIEGLSNYYKGLLEDCQKVNSIEAISPVVINEPSIYGIIASKCQVAELKGIEFNFESFFDYKKLNMDVYNFCKILGILLDNAIEAAEETHDKIINLTIKENIKKNIQTITIENTYKNKTVDLKKIYEKGYSSKKRNSGIGLWEVRNIINKNLNVKLYTTKDNKYFKQQLSISAV